MMAVKKQAFTAPSIEGQAAVIAMAQAKAGVSPDSISYIETHGTATPICDPIEIEALTQAFRSKTDKKTILCCWIGKDQYRTPDTGSRRCRPSLKHVLH